ncbi:Paraquat-inducible protein A [Aquimixticola soesokkakensis]|uniref:Paraquat-inducible protein A n=1 Tax=Aquimixticola soesokkakensis TaxID=1519096 RepID=A0A1Y5S4M1_9RHOB|nr:paraquat-inducible protein A [Aquimixticola soesokkakensis]SLN29958.1 Paraquat-inducible protein A [Aquimixticola soesokkakensis]
MSALRIANLSLLILYPIAWAAPLLKAGLLPLFKLSQISVLSGLSALWHTDLFLFGVVLVFAVIAPVAKIVALDGALRRNRHPLRSVTALGRLAMADIFLMAIYVTVIKGIGIGRVEVGWGLYLFTACVVMSLWISACAKRRAP